MDYTKRGSSLRSQNSETYFGHVTHANSLEKVMMLGNVSGTRRGRQRTEAVSTPNKYKANN